MRACYKIRSLAECVLTQEFVHATCRTVTAPARNRAPGSRQAPASMITRSSGRAVAMAMANWLRERLSELAQQPGYSSTCSLGLTCSLALILLLVHGLRCADADQRAELEKKMFAKISFIDSCFLVDPKKLDGLDITQGGWEDGLIHFKLYVIYDNFLDTNHKPETLNPESTSGKIDAAGSFKLKVR